MPFPGRPQAGQELRVEILGRISDQVKKSLEQARRESETKVKQQLKWVYDKIGQLDKLLDRLLLQIQEADASRNEVPPEEPLEHGTVAKAMAKVEQAWGKELGKLKQELHQTIFAHNHNADLMKQQKDALDRMVEEVEATHPAAGGGSSATVERRKMARALFDKVQEIVKEDRQNKMDGLLQRLEAVERRINLWQVSGGVRSALPPGNIAAVQAQAMQASLANLMMQQRGGGAAAVRPGAAGATSSMAMTGQQALPPSQRSGQNARSKAGGGAAALSGERPAAPMAVRGPLGSQALGGGGGPLGGGGGLLSAGGLDSEALASAVAAALAAAEANSAAGAGATAGRP
eukprot:TRINITY_DN24138_c0_g3_i2.p1 TRINITY_DN24138_c0_g3~~TRINITY_DN24138_c0_g3_i2.p1  ORF type:complete len:346 (+),score=98.60 TRINITY_DN24138_c0_g3_i2:110-1147(+)